MPVLQHSVIAFLSGSSPVIACLERVKVRQLPTSELYMSLVHVCHSDSFVHYPSCVTIFPRQFALVHDWCSCRHEARAFLRSLSHEVLAAHPDVTQSMAANATSHTTPLGWVDFALIRLRQPHFDFNSNVMCFCEAIYVI